MTGWQFWLLVAFFAGSAWVVHRDRTVWAHLRPHDEPHDDHGSLQVTPPGVLREKMRNQGAQVTDVQFDEISEWVRDLHDDPAGRVYATVSRDVAAQRAHLEDGAA